MRIEYKFLATDPASDGWWISTADEDLMRDRVVPEGCDVSAYLRNPIVLWCHDSSGITQAGGLPLGTSTGIEIVPGQGVRCRGISWSDATPFHRTVRELWEARVLRGASIGFVGTDVRSLPSGGREFRSWRLLEWSIVPVPANPEAVRQAEAVAKALGADELIRRATLVRQAEPGTDVQTLILSKEVFDSVEAARRWVREHDFSDASLDETEQSYRFRQFPPEQCRRNALGNGQTFATIELDRGVQAVICRRRANRARHRQAGSGLDDLETAILELEDLADVLWDVYDRLAQSPSDAASAAATQRLELAERLRRAFRALTDA